MKCKLLQIIYLFFLTTFTFCQTDSSFIYSFKNYTGENITNSLELTSDGEDMSKSEALKYVYNFDTTRLNCINEEFDMIKGQVVDTYTVKNMPKKLFRIKRDSLNFIFYSYVTCNDPEAIDWGFLEMKIYKKAQCLDTVVLLKTDDFDNEIISLANFNNMMFFISEFNQKKQLFIYELIKVGQTVEKVKSFEVKEPFNNLYEGLKKLNLENLFYSY